MKLVRVSLGKTINTGNYESVRVDFSVDVGDSTLEEVIEYLEGQIEVYERSLNSASESVFKIKRSLRLVEKFCELKGISLEDVDAALSEASEAVKESEPSVDDIPF